MQIGMVTACYEPVINGVTRMVTLYKKYLEAAGHEITVFTLDQPAMTGFSEGVVRSPGIRLGDSGYFISLGYSREARKRLTEMDIIHCHHLIMSVELAHRYASSPIVYTNHTRYDLYTGAYTPLNQPSADALMRTMWPTFTGYCDTVITPSEGVKQVMLDFGVTQPIEVISNGIESERFRNPDSPLSKGDLGVADQDTLFVYVGRLTKEKQVMTLLRQFAAAQSVVSTMRLLYIGYGQQLEQLKTVTRELDLADKVHFTGKVDFDEVPNYLAACDAFVSASTSEVHPLTVIEAKAAGLPIVAVRSPGIEDTVNSMEDGILVHSADGALAAAMVALTVDRPRMEQYSRSALQSGSQFDISVTVDKTLDLYDRLMESRPDLERKKAHGRWMQVWPTLQPVVENLGRMISPSSQKDRDLG